MKTQESELLQQVIEIYPSNIGKLFLFKDVVLFEAEKGIHLNTNNTSELFNKINSYYHEKPIGFISNRVNNYSIEALDYKKFFEILPNIKVYCAVYYNLQNAYNIEIEKKFAKVPFIGFKQLVDAFIFANLYIEELNLNNYKTNT